MSVQDRVNLKAGRHYVASYKGQVLRMTAVDAKDEKGKRTGKIAFQTTDGKVHNSPSTAAIHAVQKIKGSKPSINGWAFWTELDFSERRSKERAVKAEATAKAKAVKEKQAAAEKKAASKNGKGSKAAAKATAKAAPKAKASKSRAAKVNETQAAMASDNGTEPEPFADEPAFESDADVPTGDLPEGAGSDEMEEELA
jgi:hypothetical protein